MSEDLDKQMERLQAARDKVDSLGREQSRIQGNLERVKMQIADLEERCKNDFGCAIEELPDLVENLKKQAEENLVMAEEILEGKVPATPIQASPPKPAVAKQVPSKVVEKDRVRPETVEDSDDDGSLF